MIKLVTVLIVVLFTGSFAMSAEIDREVEIAEIERVIHLSIEWPFPEKDINRCLSPLAKDEGFFVFHPDSASTIVGFEAFKKHAETIFMNDACKPISSDIRDMRISLSKSGEVAWFSAILDDFGEWDGKPWEWVNTRWTGVLEKRDGEWLIAQMHFSFASDAKDEKED
ncbi:MAG: hypothetical protein DRP45_11320 [Candidatus Zixiibacteriota bacterium]|nr:MAG: hypothetical protein DRP45_11320 [candidate division Zixibacteria bacterium]